jgi:hypothetical protein
LSGWSAFQEVALLDTGSTDRTVEVFEEWAAAEKERQPGFVATLDHFEWVDDFAAARNAADELLETDWLMTADADDEIIHPDRLRLLVGEAVEANADGVLVPYRFAEGDRDENPPPRVQGEFGPEDTLRVRLHRRGRSHWQGRIHEHLDIPGLVLFMRDPDICHWQHQRRFLRPRSTRRNIKILRSWVLDEPANLLPLGMLAVTHLSCGEPRTALQLFERYVALRYHSDHYPDSVRRATVHWALGELARGIPGFRWTGRPDEQIVSWYLPLVTIVLGRPYFAWMATNYPESLADAPLFVPIGRQPEEFEERGRAHLRVPGRPGRTNPRSGEADVE